MTFRIDTILNFLHVIKQCEIPGQHLIVNKSLQCYSQKFRCKYPTCDHVIHLEVVTSWKPVDACKWPILTITVIRQAKMNLFLPKFLCCG